VTGSVPETVQATFCATLVDEWARAGVTDAVVAPGSRSTPLALALTHDERLRVHVHHDERAAGFVALGLGLAAGRPAVVLTTSGTAAAELHPAVLEAHQAGVPLLACTANRPPELHDVGAPQTIDQTHLFGRAARWFCAPGVADADSAVTWRSLAARAVVEAMGTGAGRPGPVHLDLAFRDPLTGSPGDLPAGRAGGAPWHRAGAVATVLDGGEAADLVASIAGRRGLIVAGGGAGDATDVHALAEALGWPVLADPRSGCRLPLVTTVAHADAVLRAGEWAAAHRPEVVLRLGASPASRVLSEWLAGTGADQVMAAPAGAWPDPDRTAGLVAAADPGAVAAGLLAALDDRSRPASDGWLEEWAAADQLAADAIAEVLAAHHEPAEPGVARAAVAALPDGASLVVASSMPIRDVEWYAAPRDGTRILANRGANGIDGVVSTAVGVSLGTGAPVAALVGDVAFLHDATALLGATGRGIALTVVVVDNDGGGIFSFLPQARLLPAARFERLFGTPHGVRVDALAATLGAETTVVDEAAAVEPAIGAALDGGGVRVVVVRTDRAANVKIHDELHAAVAAALTDG
jgi:2-succinyl-5-enolpyruvyl-6-hydroxy-3-cyclohexene-1-carboxylate synthase